VRFGERDAFHLLDISTNDQDPLLPPEGLMGAPNCVAVLVVEDEQDVRESIVEYLELEGFHVHAATNGEEAIAVLQTMPQPALIIADMMMPIMDGPGLIAALRDNDQFASLPVVIFSASDATAPTGYRRIKKPFDLDDLLKVVSEFCVRRT
jgi:CheY-like chemotaxis protein